jgi:class 3 adenylate cyclase/pimeloyl-ACP methyl ester carboxylesterase
VDYRVEYFKSSDGASIAAGRAGSGTPLFIVPGMVETIEMPLTNYVEAFPGREIILYDRRGSGLSQRDPKMQPFDLFLADAQAVLDGCDVDDVAVLATLMGTVEATALAAQNPDRVTQLVLRSPVISMADWAQIPGIKAARAAMEQDWDFYVEAFGQMVVGWGNPGGPAVAHRFRENTSREELASTHDALAAIDLEGYYSELRAPTMVEHHPTYFFPRTYTARIASLIDDCRLEVYRGDRSDFLQDFSITRRFFSEQEAALTSVGFQTILFTDLESSTAMTQRLGDEAAQVLLERHDTVVRDALQEHNGREVKHTGDGIMATFNSPAAAVQAAQQMRQRLVAEQIWARIGLNSGEPIARGGDLFGTAVQLAARVADHAEAGQVLVSNVVQELCAGKSFGFRSIGSIALKGFEEPVQLHEVDD